MKGLYQNANTYSQVTNGLRFQGHGFKGQGYRKYGRKRRRHIVIDGSPSICVYFLHVISRKRLIRNACMRGRTVQYFNVYFYVTDLMCTVLQ